MYEPGKRHWLKVKKDYLEGGAMADTADLIVLGAYYGTGNKGVLVVACAQKYQHTYVVQHSVWNHKKQMNFIGDSRVLYLLTLFVVF